jgi:hypothetical protein
MFMVTQEVASSNQHHQAHFIRLQQTITFTVLAHTTPLVQNGPLPV